MSVAFDAVGPNSSGASGNSVTSLSWTHTPSGTPSAASVQLGYFNGNTATSSVTYGGTSMGAAAVTRLSADPGRASIYGLASPASGAQTVTVTFGANIFGGAGSITVTGSDTTTCFSNVDGSATGTSASAACTVTSATGELVVEVVNGGNGTTGVTISSSGTRRWGVTRSGTESISAAATAPGAASVTMTETLSASKIWAIVGASFKAASGGVTVSVPTGSLLLAGAATTQVGKSVSAAIGILLLAGAAIGARAGKSVAVAVGVLLLAGAAITAIFASATVSVIVGVLLLAGTTIGARAGKSAAAAVGVLRLTSAGIGATLSGLRLIRNAWCKLWIGLGL